MTMAATNGERAQSGGPDSRNGRRTNLFGEFEAAWSDLSHTLREQVVRRPYSTAAGGLAAGFVLGGGLTPRIAAMMIATAGRAVMASAVAQVVQSLTRTGRSTE